jgi:hypothetical protein
MINARICKSLSVFHHSKRKKSIKLLNCLYSIELNESLVYVLDIQLYFVMR